MSIFMRINSLQSGQSTRVRNLQLKRFFNYLPIVKMLLISLTSCSQISTIDPKEIGKEQINYKQYQL